LGVRFQPQAAAGGTGEIDPTNIGAIRVFLVASQNGFCATEWIASRAW